MTGHGQTALRAARIAAFAASYFCGSSAFAAFYAVQVGAYTDESQAATVQRQFLSKGYPAVTRWEAHPTHPYKVTLGQFEAKTEADAHRDKLRQAIGSDLFTVTRPDSERSSSPAAIAIAKPVSTEGINNADPLDLQEYLDAAGFGTLPAVSAETLQKTPQQMLKDELFDVGRNAVLEEKDAVKQAKKLEALERFIAAEPASERNAVAKLHLMRALGRKPENEVRVNTLFAELARSTNTKHQKMAHYLEAFAKLNQKKYHDAAARFCTLASDASLPPYFRKKSLTYAAATLHYHVKDVSNAWLAYRELEKVNDPELAANARVEMIALQWEQVLCEKGTWDDVRKMCISFLSNKSNPHKSAATVALMELETFWEESNKLSGKPRTDKLHIALGRVRDFLLSYGDVKREADLARCWQSLFLMKLGHLQEARDGFDIIINLPENQAEQFAGLNPPALAALYAAVIANQQGDIAARDRYIAILDTRFPGSIETRHCHELFK